jgi:hypothetical protein
MAVAAIHYRESGFEREANNAGGALMMDQGGATRGEFIRRIRDEEKRVARRYCLWTAPRVRDDFRFACLCAADELRGKLRGRIWLRSGKVDEEVLADAFWGYNGRTKRVPSWRRSSYVNNDPLRGRRYEARWRHKKGEIYYCLDTRPGALTIYRELVRINAACSTMLE